MNIGIVGLGLIGGSLGLDLRSRGYQVFGVSRREQTCQQAIARGVVDDASVDLALLAKAEVVFICTPLAAIVPTVEQLIPYLSAGTVLTDVGSVKAPVVEAIAPLWPNFIGGHPMAGTADSGIEAAVPDLFALKPYVLTPVATTPAQARRTVEKIARSLRATVYHCRPEDHDRAVSWISHLPVMVSAGLIAACISETDPAVLALAQQLASSGFRDTSPTGVASRLRRETPPGSGVAYGGRPHRRHPAHRLQRWTHRVGGGNPELGVMMAHCNRRELLRSLQHYRHNHRSAD